MAKPIKIFFVTDVHGSNVCYRKFLNALKVYKVDVGILLGDLTGKMLIPLVEKAGGGRMTTFMGRQTEVTTQEELDKYLNQIAFSSANDFLDKYKDQANNLIGHFGLGFYSSFSVNSDWRFLLHTII
jgi:Icc-related predicted phosphoesterase